MRKILALLGILLWVPAADAQLSLSGAGVAVPGGGSSLTIVSASVSPSTFTGGVASGTVVGAITVNMSGGSFTGSYALSTSSGGCNGTNGANNSSFQIVGSNLETNGVVAGGMYAICIAVTQSGASNSPFGQALTITGTGPFLGDIQTSGQVAYWGLRAYTAAIAAAGTQPLVNLRRSADSHTCDILVSSSGGMGNTANCSTGGDNGTAFASWATSNVYVTTWYNQVSSCSGCNLTQSNASLQPLLYTGFAKPIVAFDGSSYYLEGSLAALPEPQTWVGAIRPVGSGTGNEMLSHLDNTSSSWSGRFMDWNGSSPAISAYSSVSNTFGNSSKSSTANSNQSVVGLYTSTTSRTAYVENSAGTADTTSLSPTTEQTMTMGARTLSSGQSNYYNGDIYEFGIWSVAISSGNLTTMYNNQVSYGYSN